MKESSHELAPEAQEADSGTPFKQMTREKKIMFALRVAVCFLTLGFVFSDALNG